MSTFHNKCYAFILRKNSFAISLVKCTFQFEESPFLLVDLVRINAPLYPNGHKQPAVTISHAIVLLFHPKIEVNVKPFLNLLGASLLFISEKICDQLNK